MMPLTRGALRDSLVMSVPPFGIADAERGEVGLSDARVPFGTAWAVHYGRPVAAGRRCRRAARRAPGHLGAHLLGRVAAEEPDQRVADAACAPAFFAARLGLDLQR